MKSSRPLTSLILFLLLAICLILPVVLVLGCRSASGPDDPAGPTISPARVEAIARLATYAGVTADLQSHPERRAAYGEAEVALGKLVEAKRWDADAIVNALSTVPVDQLNGSEGALIASGALILLDSVGASRTELVKSDLVRAAAVGIDDGLKLALQPRSRSVGVTRADPVLIRLTAEAKFTRPKNQP